MPWTVKDVDKHKKGLSPKQKRQWVATANSALSRCKAGKTKPKGGASCDAYAIKTANTVAGKRDWSLDERERLIRLEFSAKFNRSDGPYAYAGMVFDDYLIAMAGGRMYKVGYTFSDGTVTFEERMNWVEVEHDFKEVVRRAVTVPIRAVEGQDNRYRAYAVLFNDSDTRDLYGTWFDEKTDYAMGMYSEWPWMYHHGKNPDYGIRKVGVWDMRGIDDVGVFVGGEITAHDMYREAVEQLVGEGVLFTSSQAVHSMVAIADDGHVDVWPICEVSSTVAPGDYRMEHPISPSAVRALEILNQEETTMTWKDKLRALIEDLPADLFRSKDDGDKGADDEDKDREDDSTETKTEEGETEQPGIDADELVRAVVEALDLDKFVRAITKLDEHVRSISERVAQVEGLVAGLSRSETERVKSALDGDDWFKNLYVASRSAEEDAAATDGGDEGDVNPAQALGDDETVFGRLVMGVPQ